MRTIKGSLFGEDKDKSAPSTGYGFESADEQNDKQENEKESTSVSTKSVAGICLGLLVIYALIDAQFDLSLDGPLINNAKRTGQARQKSGRPVMMEEPAQVERPSVEEYKEKQGFLASFLCRSHRRSSFCD